MTNVRAARTPLIALMLLTGLAGCDREEPISVYQAPKDPTPVITTAVGPAAAAAESSELTWTVPSGWTQEPGGGQMRFATFLVNENPKVELTVVPLGAEAGAVPANINRWEGQLGLPPSPPEKLGDVSKSEKINGLDATLVDLTGAATAKPQQRMLAAIVPHAGRVWFFKLLGPADVVGAQKANFESFMHSLKPGAAGAAPAGEAQAGAMPADHPPVAGGQAPGSALPPGHPTVGGGEGGGAAMPPGHPPVAGGGAAGAGAMPALPPMNSNIKLAKWTVPPEWKELPVTLGPRAIAFEVGTGDKKADLVVTHFPEGGAGDFKSNIDRWRGQLGLPPIQDQKDVNLKDVAIGDGQGMELQIDNPAAGKSMAVAIGAIGGELWFYKLSGKADTVAAQRPAFEAFLKSVQFSAAAPPAAGAATQP